MSLAKTKNIREWEQLSRFLVFVDNAVIFAHVGDSRIALIRNGEYKQLTNDHSGQCSYQGWSLTEEEAVFSICDMCFRASLNAIWSGVRDLFMN